MRHGWRILVGETLLMWQLVSRKEIIKMYGRYRGFQCVSQVEVLESSIGPTFLMLGVEPLSGCTSS